MPLGMEVGLDPSDIVLYGDPLPLSQKGHGPQFLAHVCCGQTIGWIQMPVGTEVGLGSGDNVLDRDPALPRPRKEHEGRPQPSSCCFR